MNDVFRNQLFEAAEPVLDEVTGVAALDADIDRVLNTACTLAAKVAVHVHSLTEVDGDLAALPESED